MIRKITVRLALAAGLAAMTSAADPAFARQSLPTGLVQTGRFLPANATTTPKLQAALVRHRETAARARGACASGSHAACALQDWQGFLGQIADKRLWEQLESVNIFVNRVPFAEDIDAWGRIDRWAAPQDFFSRGGDCEDYAIAKYLSLRSLGVPADRLLLTAVHDEVRNIGHLVLVVMLPGGAVVLDNETDFIVPWDADGPYRPLYVVNEESALFQLAAS